MYFYKAVFFLRCFHDFSMAVCQINTRDRNFAYNLNIYNLPFVLFFIETVLLKLPGVNKLGAAVSYH